MVRRAADGSAGVDEIGHPDIVLPVMRRASRGACRALLDTTNADASSSAEAMLANPRLLSEYLNDVRTLSRHVTEYNRLAKAARAPWRTLWRWWTTCSGCSWMSPAAAPSVMTSRQCFLHPRRRKSRCRRN